MSGSLSGSLSGSVGRNSFPNHGMRLDGSDGSVRLCMGQQASQLAAIGSLESGGGSLVPLWGINEGAAASPAEARCSQRLDGRGPRSQKMNLLVVAPAHGGEPGDPGDAGPLSATRAAHWRQHGGGGSLR